MTYCRTCWNLHGRTAKATLRHRWRCHVRKSRFVVWCAVAATEIAFMWWWLRP